jgi:Protein of unknown function (DUF1403)
MLDGDTASATLSRAPSWSAQSWVHSWHHPIETGRQLNFVGHCYPPTPAALFRLFTGQKRRARPDSPVSRARITVPAPSLSAWARVRATAKTPEETGFLAGAALAALHPIASHDHPIGVLWRQRLALANAAALARHAGGTEDAAVLRPATAGAMPVSAPGR